MANENKDIKRIESAVITTVTSIDRQIAFENISPYRMRYQLVGGSKIYYTSDTGDRTQDGDITVTTGNYFEGEVVRALNSSGLELQDDSGTAYITINDGGTVDIDTDLLLAGGTQDYLVTSRAISLAIVSQTAGSNSIIELYSSDGDGTDDVQISLFGVGTSASITDRERLITKYEASGTQFQLYTEAAGTGTLRPLVIYTGGNANQLYLATDGSLGAGVVPEADWLSSLTAIQFGAHGALSSDTADAAGNATEITHNLRQTAAGTYKLIASDEYSVYRQIDGRHIFEAGVPAGGPDSTAALFEVMRMEVNSGPIGNFTINEGGFELYTRIESANNANMFFVDAADDRVAVGHSAPDRIFHVESNTGANPSTVEYSRLTHTGTGAAVATLMGTGLEFETYAYGLEVGTRIESRFMGLAAGAGTEDFVTIIRSMTNGGVGGAPQTVAEFGRTTNGSAGTSSVELVPLAGTGTRAVLADANGVLSTGSPTVDHAGISVYENSTGTGAPGGTGTANKAQFLLFDTNNPASGLTPDHTNDHITVATTGNYYVSVAVSFSGTANNEIGFAVYRNNGATLLNNLHTHRLLGSGGDIGSAVISGIATLTAADTIELWWWNETANNEIVVEDCTLSIVRVS